MDIVGHKNIISCLEKSITNGTVSHSYIFCGPKNIGKDTVARWFAAKLLKTSVEELAAHPDFFEVSSDGIISKGQIDGAIERLKFTSFCGGYKVAVVSDAHNMNIFSANAFLKTLEEPPQKTIIVLITSESGKILPTIISRSVSLYFRPVSKNEIMYFLKNQYNCADAKDFATLACGRPGRAISALANPDGINYSSEAEEFYKLFFGAAALRFAAVNNFFSKKNEADKEVVLKKIDFWLELIRDACFFKYNLHDNMAYAKAAAIFEKIARARTAGELAVLGGKLVKMRSLISNNINIKLMLENLII